MRKLSLKYWLRKNGATNLYLKVKDDIEFKAEMSYYIG